MIALPILLIGFDGLAEFALVAVAFVVLAAVALVAVASVHVLNCFEIH